MLCLSWWSRMSGGCEPLSQLLTLWGATPSSLAASRLEMPRRWMVSAISSTTSSVMRVMTAMGVHLLPVLSTVWTGCHTQRTVSS